MLTPPNQRALGKFRPWDCGLRKHWPYGGLILNILSVSSIGRDSPHHIPGPSCCQFRHTMMRAQGHFHITIFFFHDSIFLILYLMLIFSMYESLYIFLYFLPRAHPSSYIIFFSFPSCARHCEKVPLYIVVKVYQ